MQHFKRLSAIYGGFHTEIVGKQIREKHAQFFIVIDNQQRIVLRMKFRFLVRLIAFFRFIDINRNRKSCLSLRRHCLIELFLSVGFFIDRQHDTETIARLLIAKCFDCPMMESYQVFYQCQTYPRTYCIMSSVITFIETLEQSVYCFLCHQFPGVGHVNLQGIFVRQCRPDAYLPALRCILRRIRQKIVHYLVELVGIEKTKDDIGSTFKRKKLASLAKQRYKGFRTTAQKRRDVSIRYTNLQIAAFHLSKFQYLLYQTHQAGSIGSHHRVQCAFVSPALQVFERGKNDAQRSHQLMGDVCKEL